MPNKSGARGIHTAASKGHVAVVNSLIVKGENVDAATNVNQNESMTLNAEKYIHFRITTQHFILQLSLANHPLSKLCLAMELRYKYTTFEIDNQIS